MVSKFLTVFTFLINIYNEWKSRKSKVDTNSVIEGQKKYAKELYKAHKKECDSLKRIDSTNSMYERVKELNRIRNS